MGEDQAFGADFVHVAEKRGVFPVKRELFPGEIGLGDDQVAPRAAAPINR